MLSVKEPVHRLSHIWRKPSAKATDCSPSERYNNDNITETCSLMSEKCKLFAKDALEGPSSGNQSCFLHTTGYRSYIWVSRTALPEVWTIACTWLQYCWIFKKLLIWHGALDCFINSVNEIFQLVKEAFLLVFLGENSEYLSNVKYRPPIIYKLGRHWVPFWPLHDTSGV
jgi:hypothetical protein